ncbi:MAG: dehydrogenase, partial [Pirellula sp.]
GFRPALSNDRPMNLDFESGDLSDWEARGSIAAKLPSTSDASKPSANDVESKHQGKFWLGTFAGGNDKLIGETISRPFILTHAWASFLVSGGKSSNTCVEIISEQSGKVLHTATGTETETMRREVADLSAWKGTAVRIRVVDHNQDPWGHIGFDDFRLHSEKP